jgi:hypothetical protein
MPDSRLNSKGATSLFQKGPLNLSVDGKGASTSLGSGRPGLVVSAKGRLREARAEAPIPPKTSAYLPVEDLPSPREKPAMTPDERLKLKNELTAARDRQAAAGKAQGAAITEPAKP